MVRAGALDDHNSVEMILSSKRSSFISSKELFMVWPVAFYFSMCSKNKTVCILIIITDYISLLLSDIVVCYGSLATVSFFFWSSCQCVIFNYLEYIYQSSQHISFGNLIYWDPIRVSDACASIISGITN